MQGDSTGAGAEATVVAAGCGQPDPVGQEAYPTDRSREGMILSTTGTHKNGTHTQTKVQLNCPQCKQPQIMLATRFHTTTKWAISRCRKCLERNTINKWLCPCGFRWHACRAHTATYAVLTKQINTKKPTPRQKEKAKVHSILPPAARRKATGQMISQRIQRIEAIRIRLSLRNVSLGKDPPQNSHAPVDEKRCTDADKSSNSDDEQFARPTKVPKQKHVSTESVPAASLQRTAEVCKAGCYCTSCVGNASLEAYTRPVTAAEEKRRSAAADDEKGAGRKREASDSVGLELRTKGQKIMKRSDPTEKATPGRNSETGCAGTGQAVINNLVSHYSRGGRGSQEEPDDGELGNQTVCKTKVTVCNSSSTPEPLGDPHASSSSDTGHVKRMVRFFNSAQVEQTPSSSSSSSNAVKYSRIHACQIINPCVPSPPHKRLSEVEKLFGKRSDESMDTPPSPRCSHPNASTPRHTGVPHSLQQDCNSEVLLACTKNNPNFSSSHRVQDYLKRLRPHSQQGATPPPRAEVTKHKKAKKSTQSKRKRIPSSDSDDLREAYRRQKEEAPLPLPSGRGPKKQAVLQHRAILPAPMHLGNCTARSDPTPP